MALKLHQYTLAADNGVTAIDFIDIPAGGSPAWGAITGTLSSQTDLQTALDAKLVKASNLSDLASAATARTNLGLGTLATQSGTFSGTSSGTNTGDQTTVSGNAGSATVLQTARAINGVNFDGSGAITVTAAAGTLSGASLAAGVTGSSLTSVGTLTGGATGAGFTIALTTSTCTGTLPAAQMPAHTGDVTSSAGSVALTIKTSVSLTTPIIGVATGTSLAVTGLITSSGTAGIGYATGAGGTVVQATSKATGVTLNKLCGTITMNGAALAAATIVSFTVTNSTCAATDVIHVQHDTVGTIGGYTVMPNTPAAGSFRISVRNNTAGSLSEAIVLRFAIIKAVAA